VAGARAGIQRQAGRAAQLKHDARADYSEPAPRPTFVGAREVERRLDAYFLQHARAARPDAPHVSGRDARQRRLRQPRVGQHGDAPCLLGPACDTRRNLRQSLRRPDPDRDGQARPTPEPLADGLAERARLALPRAVEPEERLVY
jgi:hypothetical protein